MAHKPLRRSRVNHFFVILPNYLYPFSAMVGGKKVRGWRAYEYTVSVHERRYGKGHWGVFINLYRSFFHIIGSLIVITLFALIVRELFGTERALYAVLGAMTVAFAYQEFYYHRRVYGQIWKKGVVDWLSWVVPASIYVFFNN